MNIFIGIICLGICLFFGYKKGQNYSLRAMFYKDFSEFNDSVKNEVMYTQNSINNVINLLGGDKDFPVLLKKYINNGQLSEISYLTKEENEHVNYYMKTLGKGDKQSQLSFLSSEKVKIDGKKEDTENERKKYKPLCVKLGLLIGLIALIVLL